MRPGSVKRAPIAIGGAGAGLVAARSLLPVRYPYRYGGGLRRGEKTIEQFLEKVVQFRHGSVIVGYIIQGEQSQSRDSRSGIRY